MKYAKISRYTEKKLLRSFSQDKTASQASVELKLHRHTVNLRYRIFRESIVDYQKARFYRETDNYEIRAPRGYFDEFFGSNNQITTDCLPRIEIFSFNGILFTSILQSDLSIPPFTIGKKNKARALSRKKSPLYIIIDGKRKKYDKPDPTIVYSYYQVDLNYESTNPTFKSDLITEFIGYLKSKIKKHYGVSRNKLFFYLKETEFRFNMRYRKGDVYQVLYNWIYKKH